MFLCTAPNTSLYCVQGSTGTEIFYASIFETTKLVGTTAIVITETSYVPTTLQSSASSTGGINGIPPSSLLSSSTSTQTCTPLRSQNITSALPTSAKIGIGVGATVAFLVILGVLFFYFVKRRRRRRSQPRSQNVHEKGLDNTESKPELAGSAPSGSGPYTLYEKPELAVQRKTMIESTSETNPLYGIPMASSNTQTQPLHGQSDSRVVKAVPDRLGPQILGASAIPSPVEVTTDDINIMKAQERELAHRVELNESLMKLKAEHAALQERIRLAEMQVREVNERS